MVEAALTVAAACRSDDAASVEPDGLENCRLPVPSAAFSCDNDRRHAAGEIDADHAFGLAFGAFGNGSAVGSSTLTIDDLMLGVGRAVGVGQVDRVARQHVRQIEIEARRRPGDRRCRRWSCPTARSTSTPPADRPGSAPAPGSCRAASDRPRSGPKLIELFAIMSIAGAVRKLDRERCRRRIWPDCCCTAKLAFSVPGELKVSLRRRAPPTS